MTSAGQPTVRRHRETLASRLARSRAVVPRTQSGAGSMPQPSSSQVEAALDAVARLAARLGAESVDATLTQRALRVALRLRNDELPETETTAHRAVRDALGVPLVLTAHEFVSIPGPEASEPCLDAAGNTALEYLARIRAFEADAIGDRDPESVHQLRVAARRLRTVLRLIARELPSAPLGAVVQAVRRVADAAGDVRDRDVAREILSGLQIADEPRKLAMDAIDRQRARHLEKLRHLLESAAHGAALTRSEAVLASLSGRPAQRTVQEAAQANLSRDLKRLARQLRRPIASAEDYHLVRRRARRVRDTAEVFGSAMRHGSARWRSRLSPVQSMLGQLNDLENLMQMLPNGGAALRSALRSERIAILAELAAPLALAAVWLSSDR